MGAKMGNSRSHSAFMRWRKDELVDLAADHARSLGLTTKRYQPDGLRSLDKRTVANLCVELAHKLSVRQAMQGE